MTAADQIRRAAARLRELAEGATPGPWRADVRDGERLVGIDGPNHGEVLLPGPVDCMSYCYGGTSTIEGDRIEADATYIAALGPDVGLALADWLDDVAYQHDEDDCYRQPPPNGCHEARNALAVARKILGES